MNWHRGFIGPLTELQTEAVEGFMRRQARHEQSERLHKLAGLEIIDYKKQPVFNQGPNNRSTKRVRKPKNIGGKAWINSLKKRK